MSKDTTLSESFSTAIRLLRNKIEKIECAKTLFAINSSVHDILKVANLEECCSFVGGTIDKLVASQELKTSLNSLRSQQSILSKYNTIQCKKFEERNNQIDKIIQARELFKCIDQHDFKEALKIAGLSYIIKKAAPGITRIWITEDTFFKNLDKYLEVKQKEYKIIVDAYAIEYGHLPSSSELSPSTSLEVSSNCNNMYVTNLAADSVQASVLTFDQHLYPQLPQDITTTSHTMNFPKKARKLAPPPPPIQPSAPPSYTATVHDVSRAELNESNLDHLGDVHDWCDYTFLDS